MFKPFRIFALTTSILLCVCSLAFATPKIEFEKETIDFGKAMSGSPIKITYKFTNVGDSELVITNVRPGCGCTHAEALEKNLAPGKSSIIEAELKSLGYEGKMTKGITVSSNDPLRQTISLKFTGEIVALAKMKPERINFGSIKVNTIRSHVLRVLPSDPKTFMITKVEPQGTHVTVPSFKKIQDKDKTYWELTLNIKAGDKPERVFEFISIFTNVQDSVLMPNIYGNVVE